MVNVLYEDNNMVAVLYGDIDHHTARVIREKLDEKIKLLSPKVLCLDFKNVSFMDSSGIGLIIGRYKLLSSIEGELQIKNATSSINRVIKLSGIERLATIVEE